jgi:hypothetical protein
MDEYKMLEILNQLVAANKQLSEQLGATRKILITLSYDYAKTVSELTGRSQSDIIAHISDGLDSSSNKWFSDN